MCGISGFQSNIRHKEVVVRQMMHKIRHRGPDESGVYIDKQTALGHVRLSIIDIESGQQPISSKDGRYVMVFNGEIYNYLELRQLLFSKGIRLQTHSDSEVLLYMYILYGRECLNKLNGMFAFAVYDTQEESIFLARDHFGIKPLYYFCHNGHFVFASEIKALLAYPEIKAELDTHSLQEYLTFQFVLKKHTLFKNIYTLEPATYMLIKNASIVEKSEYWQLQYGINEEMTEAGFADELLLLLDSSLSMQVRSDVPVGAYLSGGLDSSTVAVLASKKYLGSLKTFTGAFKDDAIFDETAYAKIVSRAIGSEYHEVFPCPDDFISVFPKLVYAMDQPGAGPGLFPQYMVSKLASEHVKVVLGGQGGDEVFGGYARYAVAYLEQCLKGAIFETQEEGKHIVTLQQIIKNLPLLKQYVPMLKKQFSNGLFDSMAHRYFDMINRSPSFNGIYHSDVLKERDDAQLFDKYLQIFNKPDTLSYFNKMTYFDTKTLLPALLQVEDRMSMSVSVETRVPLLDRRIVELAASMPPAMKFAGGKTKYMLLQAVKNILPPEVIERKDKMGFPVPLNNWFANELNTYVCDIFNSQKTKERGLFNNEKIQQQLTKGGMFDRDMWGALNLELWFRTFID